MPKFTDFLKLTLGEFKEFVNSWHKPINQNFEDIDDWLKGLHDELVGTGSDPDYADLRGDLNSLADRLNVSINPDGTIDPTNSPDILNMATSAVDGVFSSPRDRLDAKDLQTFEARQPFSGDRFAPIPLSGPAAGFPYEDIDSGIAVRTGHRGSTALASPHIPPAQGLIMGNASLVAPLSIGQVRLTGDTPPAVFNIDGYIFRIREIIDFDWNDLGPSNGQWVWIFVERTEAQYNNGSYRYSALSGSAFAAKDLRKLQFGSDGIASNSTFSSASAVFNTGGAKMFGKVRSGDILVIESGLAAGEYVINALDGTTPETKLTIKGTFKANVSGAAWHVIDRAHPNIGAVLTAANVLPPQVAGRAYIARAVHSSSGSPTGIVNFAMGGVVDTGWIEVDATTDFPLDLDPHNLGAVPTSIEIWCRTDENATEIYPAMVRRSVVTDTAGPTSATFLFPSFHIRSSDTQITLILQNASTVPLVDAAIFTDSAGVDHAEAQIRVIARK